MSCTINLTAPSFFSDIFIPVYEILSLYILYFSQRPMNCYFNPY